MELFSVWLADAMGMPAELVKKAVSSFLIVLGYFAGRRLLVYVVSPRVDDPAARFRIHSAARALLLVSGGVLMARVWFKGAEGIGTWLGIVTAGLAVALQNPLENLAGWGYLVAERPFRVGDRIQIGEHAGDVLDIKPLSFTLLEIGNWVDADQSTGRLLHVPNGWVFKYSISDYDQGFPYIWNEIPVTVTFESDWRAARKALEEILEIHAEKASPEEFERPSEHLSVRYSALTPIVWLDRAPEGVRLTMRYLCRPRARRSSTSAIWEEIFDRFKEIGNIEFAYSTTRFFESVEEGKPELHPHREHLSSRP